jgi:hypothetical protein
LGSQLTLERGISHKVNVQNDIPKYNCAAEKYNKIEQWYLAQGYHHYPIGLQWYLAQGYHHYSICLLLTRADIDGVEMVKHHFRLTCNLVNKAT